MDKKIQVAAIVVAVVFSVLVLTSPTDPIPLPIPNSNSESDFVADGNYAWEFWYAFKVTDNITVTPAIYYLSRPFGDLTNGAGGAANRNDTFNNFGGILKTTFMF